MRYTMFDLFKRYIFQKLNIIYICCFIFLIYQLSKNIKNAPVDMLIVSTNLFTLSINIIYLIRIQFLYKKISNILIPIIIRLSKNKTINYIINFAFIDISIHIILIYFLPIIIFKNYIYNFQLYLIFCLILFFTYLIFYLMYIYMLFTTNKILNIILVVLPFIITLVFQNTIFQYMYF